MKSKRVKILAIDDDPNILTMLKAIVANKLPGSILLTARSGPEGIELARAKDPDVILLDIVMRKMDGYTVCRKLKKDKLLRMIPVLFLTALRTDRESRVKALEAGAEGFLSKPFDIVELIAQIRSMTKIKAASRMRHREKERLIEHVSKRTRMLEQELAKSQRMEEELLRSEERFRLLSTVVSNLIWEWDIASGRLDWFGDIDAMLGYDPGEFPRTITAWEEAIFPEEHNRVMSALDKHLTFNEAYLQEYWIRRKDGGLRCWRDTGVSIRDPGGKAIRMIGSIADITGRKQEEVALRESEGKYRQLIEMISDALFLIDNETGDILEVNRAAERLYGYTHGELLRMKNADMSAQPEETRQATQGMLNHISLRFHRKKDGTVFPVEITASHYDLRGRTVHIAAIRDVSERLVAEDALKTSEERYRLLIENVGESIIVVQDGHLKFANAKASQLIGYSLDDIMLQPLINFIHVEDRASVVNNQLHLLKGEEVASRFSFRVLHRSGDIRWVEINIVLIEWQGKKATLNFLIDITDRMRIEEEKDKLWAQLLQSQKMESIGRLAGGVAHDFNNMLSVILGQVEMALEQVNPAQPLFTSLQEIRKAAEHSTGLTRQLLTFARKQTIAPQSLDLNDTVERLLGMLRRLIGEDIELVWLPSRAIWAICIDPSQIDQILVNLCVNAREAIKGAGKITIQTETVTIKESEASRNLELSAGEYVLLAVNDSGCGMDKKTLEMLFEPFFTTKKKGKNTGLGLATVYGIIKQNNGLINVFSEPGRGSTFKIYLPRYRGKVPALQTEASAIPYERGQETILLVEDEPTILKLTTAMLERQGYTVLSVSTPNEAVTLASEYPGEIHLLMTDVIMPDMDGLELANKLMSFLPELKRLFMSGYTSDIIMHHGVLNEGICFIQKPFTLQDLSKKVREALDKD